MARLENEEGPQLQLITVEDANEMDGLDSAVQTNVGGNLPEEPPNA